MALQWRQPPNALKAAKTLGEMLITLALNYASPFFYKHFSLKDLPLQRCEKSHYDLLGLLLVMILNTQTESVKTH